MPGPKGQPPAEVTDFVPPIAVLDSGMFSDGGTTFLHLQDRRGAELIMCITQDAFEDDIKGNSLMIGGPHSRAPGVRFPLSQQEAKLMVASLEAVVASFERNTAVRVERKSDETSSKTAPEANDLEEDDWRLGVAQNALKRLAHRDDFELADAAELAARTKRLESVDLALESKRFREHTGLEREKTWERLKPAFFSELKSLPRIEQQARIIELLGPSDADAEKRCRRPMFSPIRPASIVAYNLFSKDNYFRDLVFYFDKHGNFEYEEIAIALPPKHDKAKQ
jgi:hypothetical protein